MTPYTPEPAPESALRGLFAKISFRDNLTISCALGEVRDAEDDEILDEMFMTVLNKNIEELRTNDFQGPDGPIHINPYNIGMTYIHRMIYGPYEDEIPVTDTSVGNVSLALNIEEIEKNLMQFTLDRGELVGLPFIAEGKCKLGTYYGTFLRERARCIGSEQVLDPRKVEEFKGGAYFVAKQFAAFALNSTYQGQPEKFAERLKLFTVTYFRKNEGSFAREKFLTTITTRTFGYLKSVAGAIEPESVMIRVIDRSTCEKLPVLVTLGTRKYKTDLLLYKLALKLRDDGHPLVLYFHNFNGGFSHFLENSFEEFMKDEMSWMRYGGVQSTMARHKLTGKYFGFAINFVGTVEYEEPCNGVPVHMTMPMPDGPPETSIELTRHQECTVGLFSIAKKLIGEEVTAPIPVYSRRYEDIELQVMDSSDGQGTSGPPIPN